MAREKKQRDLAKRVLDAALLMEEAAVRFRDPKLRKIQKAEDMYNMLERPRLSGRFNYQLPILSGFVDTLMAKIDDAPILQFAEGEEADIRKAKKISAAWAKDSTDHRVALATRDRGAKKLSIFSGRGILKFYQESDPEYRLHVNVVDHHDFLAEPSGGSILEEHRFKGQQNIERSKSDIINLMNAGVYDRAGGQKILSLQHDPTYQSTVSDASEMKKNRFISAGLNPEMIRHTDEPVFSLTEMTLLFEGQWYHIVYSLEAKVWVRFAKNKEVFGSDMSPWISFATHENPFNFWSKAVVDDLVPVAEGMTEVFNQALTNRWRQNKGMRVFDEDVFEDPTELKKWIDDGLIPAKLGPGKHIGNAVYEFKTPEIGGTIDLFTYMDNFLGQKTGVTASAQGTTDKNTKASVYFGDLKQVADRLGLVSKSYNDMWKGAGYRYVKGLQEHMPEKFLVKMTGERGVEWDEMTKEDTRFTREFDITVSSGTEQSEVSEIEKRSRAEALSKIAADPTAREHLSGKWLTTEILRTGGYSEEDIRLAMNKDNYGRQDELSRASEAIQKILDGKQPRLYRGATTAYMQKILDYATEHEISDEMFMKLTSFANRHLPLTQENVVRQARKDMSGRSAIPEAEPEAARASPESMVPGADTDPRSMVPSIGNEMAPNL